MTIRIHHIAISKARLAEIPEPERNLFILLGHAANEVSILSKLFHFCAGTTSTDAILVKSEHAQALLLGRLLTGKIYEFWSLLQTGYFGSAVARSYYDILDNETREALDAMKRYFAQDNLVVRVRNSFAFHYDVNQIADGFRRVAENESLDIYLSENNVNSLYAFADTIAGLAMLENIFSTDHVKAFNLLVSETARAAGWVNAIIGGLMVTCLQRNFGDNLYSLGARVIELDGAPSSQSAAIPFFIEVPRKLPE